MPASKANKAISLTMLLPPTLLRLLIHLVFPHRIPSGFENTGSRRYGAIVPEPETSLSKEFLDAGSALHQQSEDEQINSVEHLTPMLSLANSYNEENLVKFDK